MRTYHDSWEHEVFGQAARLAFYHFLALFPALLLLMFLLLKFSAARAGVRGTLLQQLQQLLPNQAFFLVSGMVQELNGRAQIGGGFVWAILVSVWASVNGTWALMSGLNTAYEVKEKRPVWKITAIAIGLTVTLAILGLLSLTLIFYGHNIAHGIPGATAIPHRTLLWLMVVRWPMIVLLLVISFAILYRFAPNLSNRKWRWSTPGAVVALALWISASLLLRLYFTYSHSYEQVYGHLAAVSMLLVWLYLTSAAILIGGEMNSEIEKAAHGSAKTPPQSQQRQDRSGNS